MKTSPFSTTLTAVTLVAMASLSPAGIAGEIPAPSAAASPLPVRSVAPVVGSFFGPATAIGIGPEPIPYFFALSLHSDGTADSTTTFDLQAPPSTPGKGSWAEISRSKYTVALVGATFNSVTDPTPIGTYRVHGTVSTDAAGSEITHDLTIDLFDLSGGKLFSFQSQALHMARVVPD